MIAQAGRYLVCNTDDGTTAIIVIRDDADVREDMWSHGGSECQDYPEKEEPEDEDQQEPEYPEPNQLIPQLQSRVQLVNCAELARPPPQYNSLPRILGAGSAGGWTYYPHPAGPFITKEQQCRREWRDHRSSEQLWRD